MKIQLNTYKIMRAFELAQRGHETDKLRGRGHVMRASVGTGGQISLHARLGASKAHARICGSKHGAPRVVFPLAVIHKAEVLLGLEFGQLVGRVY